MKTSSDLNSPKSRNRADMIRENFKMTLLEYAPHVAYEVSPTKGGKIILSIFTQTEEQDAQVQKFIQEKHPDRRFQGHKINIIHTGIVSPL